MLFRSPSTVQLGDWEAIPFSRPCAVVSGGFPPLGRPLRRRREGRGIPDLGVHRVWRRAAGDAASYGRWFSSDLALPRLCSCGAGGDLEEVDSCHPSWVVRLGFARSPCAAGSGWFLVSGGEAMVAPLSVAFVLRSRHRLVGVSCVGNRSWRFCGELVPVVGVGVVEAPVPWWAFVLRLLLCRDGVGVSSGSIGKLVRFFRRPVCSDFFPVQGSRFVGGGSGAASSFLRCLLLDPEAGAPWPRVDHRLMLRRSTADNFCFLKASRCSSVLGWGSPIVLFSAGVVVL